MPSDVRHCTRSALPRKGSHLKSLEQATLFNTKPVTVRYLTQTGHAGLDRHILRSTINSAWGRGFKEQSLWQARGLTGG
jgi:hypothetical protein